MLCEILLSAFTHFSCILSCYESSDCFQFFEDVNSAPVNVLNRRPVSRCRGFSWYIHLRDRLSDHSKRDVWLQPGTPNHSLKWLPNPQSLQQATLYPVLVFSSSYCQIFNFCAWNHIMPLWSLLTFFWSFVTLNISWQICHLYLLFCEMLVLAAYYLAFQNEFVGVSLSNLDFNLWFIQSGISHNELCI